MRHPGKDQCYIYKEPTKKKTNKQTKTKQNKTKKTKKERKKETNKQTNTFKFSLGLNKAEAY